MGSRNGMTLIWITPTMCSPDLAFSLTRATAQSPIVVASPDWIACRGSVFLR